MSMNHTIMFVKYDVITKLFFSGFITARWPVPAGAYGIAEPRYPFIR